MMFVHTLLIFICLAIAMATGGCARDVEQGSVPALAQANIEGQYDYEKIKPVIFDFARTEGFAVGEVLTRPRGLLDFMVILYRDDIRIVVAKGKENPVSISAHALCACEADRNPNVQIAANEAIKKLAQVLHEKK